ncbi:MOSC domain-containing protein [Porticoccus sp. W117]|uniref:MOSC domain-containing protein n=1 Tax=Porticoccus sp. W117 TaxID=3054777 RepID=UPI002596AA7B|nr:MOSC domain-containing protein [Porticoccus sp. W117]MDM3869988.1 MOSC domain-containing protein [Porticoccus sp. W117]
MSTPHGLLKRYTAQMSPGTLRWIGLRPERRAELVIVDKTRALEGLGLEGDHRCLKTPGSGRQVTLICQEHIDAMAAILGREEIAPQLLRRNLVVSGINLLVLRHRRFRIGEAEFEGTAHCHPCSRMEETLGPGGFAAMFGHGGLCAKVVCGGELALGDSVELLS